MALADAVGNLTDFRLLPGQAHDLRGTGALIDGLTCGQLLADRAFDADWLREALTGAGIEPVIPPKSNRRFPAEFDRETYKWRHLIDIDQTLRLSRRKVGRSSDFRRRQVMHVGGSRANGFEIRNRGRVSLHQLDNLAAHFDRAVA